MKKYVVWVVAFAVILAGAWALLRQPSASAPEQPQNMIAGEATSDNKDPQDAIGSDGGASVVDLDDDQGANDEALDDTEDDPSALIPSAGIPTINEKLTWEAINAFPIKSADMSTDELRKLCVDFFHFTKTALWTPKESLSFVKNSGGSKDTLSEGIIYGGLPYVTLGSGNVYRLLDFMDESTGVVDISKFLTGSQDLSQTITKEQLAYFGNQCSAGAYWGWGRVMNSATYSWTSDMTAANGFIPLGDYTYTLTGFFNKKGYRTSDILKDNGEQTMYQAYAELKPADGLVYYTSAGHVIMCSSNAVVTYLADGVTIDGANSYIYIIDQAQSWADGKNDSGDSYRYKNSVDKKMTFAKLFDGNYIPFTFGEFLGTDPVEETEATFSYEGSTITASQLFSATVTANYGISDAYVIVTDDNGNEVYRHIVRSNRAWRKAMNMAESGDNVVKLGSLEAGTYNIEIAVQLSTGERPTVYMGTLIA